MVKESPVLSPYSAGVNSLLPLVFVAWADQVLTPEEIQQLKQKAAELTYLTPDDRQLLRKWTDPSHPPSRTLFNQWRAILKAHAWQLPEAERSSLAALGLEMARSSARPDEAGAWWASPATKAALEELETMLGKVHPATFGTVMARTEKLTTPEPAAFDIAALTKILDGPYADTNRRLRNLLSDPFFTLQNLPVKEDHRQQVLTWLKALAAQGFGNLAYPTYAGGRDDMGNYSAIFEMLGYHDLSLAIKFGVQFGLFGGSIHGLGTEFHHKKYLPAVGKAELLGCFAMTETGHGSNVRGLETTAVYDPATQEFIIHSPTFESGKEYIGNALHARMATVFAQLFVDGENHGVHALLAPIRDESGNLLPGIKVLDCGYKMGLNGVDNGRIWFDRVRVPRENLLDRFGSVDAAGRYHSPIENPDRRFFTMLGTLVGGRVCVPRAGLSAAKTGLTIAILYALRRRQFGPDFMAPETLLLDYPSHQRRLMPLLAKAYALHFGLAYLTQRYLTRSDEDIREIETLAAGLKAYATWFTTETLQECREACGGKGYLAENRLTDLKADTDIFTTFEGDNTVLWQLVAKGILSAFRKELNDEGMMGVLRILASRVSTAVTERNPIAVRNTSREHLLDVEFHKAAFTYREQRLLWTAGERLRAMIKEGRSAYDASIHCQTHLLALAEAFVERVVLEAFTKGVEACQDGGVKEILQLQCRLFALHTIEKHRAWYLESDYIGDNKSKAIRKLVDELCAESRQHAGALVRAFAIPEELLAAEIVHFQK